jgi:hypothetical protein
VKTRQVNRDKSAIDRPWNRKLLGYSFLSDKQATDSAGTENDPVYGEGAGNRESVAFISDGREDSAIESVHRGLGCERFDQWLRMYLWKQWKRVRTRIRELRALGVPEWACFVIANSRRGPWEMSRNLNHALPTSYWEAKGLKSMLSRCMELRQLFGTA